MNPIQTIRSPGATLILLLACLLCMSSANAALFWKVTRGDTLFAISRTLYPQDAVLQKRLREDIAKLNPTLFADGLDFLAVGVVLKLPDYVVIKSTKPEFIEPADVPQTIQKTLPQPVSPATIPQPVSPATIVVPEPQPVSPATIVVPEPESEPKPPEVSSQSGPDSSRDEGDFIVSIGYSFGGDELVETDGGLDFNAGSGGHLRLGYERMSQQGRGYRAALGLQYNEVDDATFRNTYLHIAYQYRPHSVLYGVGIVADTGSTFKSFGDTTDYDAALGGIVYLENFGSDYLAGLGLSYTFMDIEEKNSGESVDASRAEVYYNWKF